MGFFRSFPAKTKKARKSLQIQVDIDSTSIEMARLLERGRIPQALELVKQMREIYAAYKPRMNDSQKVTYHYMFAYAFLADENYKEALGEVNHILNNFDEGIRPDLHVYTRMLNMIIHAELNNRSVLKYEADSTARFLQKRGKMHKAETALIRFFRRVARSTFMRNDQKRKVYQQFREEFAEILEDPYEQRVRDFFDFISWLDSRIHDIPFKEAKEQIKMGKGS